MKPILLAAAFSTLSAAAYAAPETYTLDPDHSQAMIAYNHAGFSTTYWMLGGFEGEIQFDVENPASSNVVASISADKLLSGSEARENHILNSGEFFNLGGFPDSTFSSTSIEVTGEKTALITGDLTLNGVTKEIVLDAVLNAAVDAYPFPPFNGKPAIGLNATTRVLRSEFNLGLYAPFVADEIDIEISIEAMKLD